MREPVLVSKPESKDERNADYRDIRRSKPRRKCTLRWSGQDARQGLAINGGTPIRSGEDPWPAWPVAAPGAAEALSRVLSSSRWAISSRGGTELFERRFARSFAEYLGTKYCVPVDHGSSALVAALESLKPDYGDVVLVPAVTWVASATAVLRAGLVPLLVDVDRVTGCLGGDHWDTKHDLRAVVAVHWACSMADIPAIISNVGTSGASVIEDCAQAHGAAWDGNMAGTLGRLGCFSMQQAKVLTSGEGGAIVTNDDELFPILEELRADSRRYGKGEPSFGELELQETASVMGSNFCLSELSAALLCEQLTILNAQHAVRNRNFADLVAGLQPVPGVRVIQPHEKQTATCIYEIPFVFDPLPPGMSNRDVAAALTAELRVPMYVPREPLYRSRLLRPSSRPDLAPLARIFDQINSGRSFPNAEYLSQHVVLTHHSSILGSTADVLDICHAVEKVATC